MRRYRFAYSLSDLAPAELADEYCLTLDTAIVRAREIERVIRPRCIYVVDTDQSPHRPRAIVEKGVLRWMKDCHRCKATGLISKSPCTLCKGMKMIEGEPQ